MAQQSGANYAAIKLTLSFSSTIHFVVIHEQMEMRQVSNVAAMSWKIDGSLPKSKTSLAISQAVRACPVRSLGSLGGGICGVE
jgi:hypothetical protein